MMGYSYVNEYDYIKDCMLKYSEWWYMTWGMTWMTWSGSTKEEEYDWRFYERNKVMLIVCDKTLEIRVNPD